MEEFNYWLNLFDGFTWDEFLKAGACVSGFRENKWVALRQVKPGDYFLCYLTGVSRWIGVLTVQSEPYRDESPIWTEEVFPCRVRVKVNLALTPETAVPMMQFRNTLSFFENLRNPSAWTAHVRNSPRKLQRRDGEVVLNALRDAERRPVIRPLEDPRLLLGKSKAERRSRRLGVLPRP